MHTMCAVDHTMYASDIVIPWPGHSERSEESLTTAGKILRYAQDDTSMFLITKTRKCENAKETRRQHCYRPAEPEGLECDSPRQRPGWAWRSTPFRDFALSCFRDEMWFKVAR